MSFCKVKTKNGLICMGVGKLISDRNGNAVSKTESRYKFKLLGASRQIITKNGEMRWLHERLWVSVPKDDYLGEIAKDLQLGDKVYLYGVLKRSTYTDIESGKERKGLFCNAEYLVKIGHDSVTAQQPTVEELQETDDYEDDENDTFPDF